jgi:hypothetical protein
MAAYAETHQHWQLRYHHQAPPKIQAAIMTLLMIRNVPHQPSSILMAIPNELMFELFARIQWPSVEPYCMWHRRCNVLCRECTNQSHRHCNIDQSRLCIKQLAALCRGTATVRQVQQLVEAPNVTIKSRNIDAPFDTLLHLAASSNNEPLVKYLIEQHADVNAENVCGCESELTGGTNTADTAVCLHHTAVFRCSA